MLLKMSGSDTNVEMPEALGGVVMAVLSTAELTDVVFIIVI